MLDLFARLVCSEGWGVWGVLERSYKVDQVRKSHLLLVSTIYICIYILSKMEATKKALSDGLSVKREEKINWFGSNKWRK